MGALKGTLGLTLERLDSRVATLGGFGSTVGMTKAGAVRWERVMDPSELFQRMTRGVLAICVPKPLERGRKLV
jgi:hypothetical protein